MVQHNPGSPGPLTPTSHFDDDEELHDLHGEEEQGTGNVDDGAAAGESDNEEEEQQQQGEGDIHEQDMVVDFLFQSVVFYLSPFLSKALADEVHSPTWSWFFCAIFAWLFCQRQRKEGHAGLVYFATIFWNYCGQPERKNKPLLTPRFDYFYSPLNSSIRLYASMAQWKHAHLSALARLHGEPPHCQPHISSLRTWIYPTINMPSLAGFTL